MKAPDFQTRFSHTELPKVVRELLDRFLVPLPKGALVGLQGELGSGKTTLVRELVHQLRGEGQLRGVGPVSSPTYTLEHIYDTPLGAIHHWDLYRLRVAPPELYENSPLPRLTLIEWPERDELLEERLALLIKIEILDDTMRELFVYLEKTAL